MPTKKGYSRKSISFNYKQARSEGKSKKQSIARALNIASKAAKKAGKPGKAPRARAKKGKG